MLVNIVVGYSIWLACLGVEGENCSGNSGGCIRIILPSKSILDLINYWLVSKLIYSCSVNV